GRVYGRGEPALQRARDSGGPLRRAVLAHPLPQRIMQKMRGRMVLPNGITTRVVTLQQQRITNFDRPLRHSDHVSKDVTRFFLCVADGCTHTLAAYLASVPDLPAAFAVKWGLVHHHSTGFVFFQLGNLPAVL